MKERKIEIERKHKRKLHAQCAKKFRNYKKGKAGKVQDLWVRGCEPLHFSLITPPIKQAVSHTQPHHKPSLSSSPLSIHGLPLHTTGQTIPHATRHCLISPSAMPPLSLSQPFSHPLPTPSLVLFSPFIFPVFLYLSFISLSLNISLSHSLSDTFTFSTTSSHNLSLSQIHYTIL